MAEATPQTTRADIWVWSVRFFKTRSLATAACKAGHVKVNGDRAKAAQVVRIGDEIRVQTDREHIVEVRDILTKRVGAPIAQAAYLDKTPALPPRVEQPSIVHRERGAGRPTKRDRRELNRLRGRD
ncbi:RNA-binding S4 domain-containing protein [Planctomonas sp. JC2975]|uniref:RNA-binding S4 domain-containing protein n=1 Tax=Planctomonas sp. JC2975 TaxID=2729626 RepID=UPI0014742876|nr:RNA-binding S4 domain-containing protein [Planctomonas sp. JC2975]NNC11488.1 RNA-binding S4 domain-containing protein [Planctomonas sp. JC2975]